MNTQSSIEFIQKIRIPRYGIIIAVIWTGLIAYSLAWDQRQHREEALLLGKMQGHAFYEKDLMYRRWASRHGGVYVPITESTQPNPYLAHIPERDIATPTGKRLTLINPAYMTRQVFEMAQEYKGTGRGHITSLKPIRPENAPDAWERQALQDFEHGRSEIGELEELDGKPYYRYMKALIVEKPCLKCHLSQGYHVGEVRGGLSVSVNMEPIHAMMAHEMHGVYVNHAFIWLLGLGVIGFGTRRLDRMTTNLYNKTIELEYEVSERQTAQESLQEQAVILEEEIVERRQIEEAVRLSEEKFSRAFDNAPIMMAINSLDDGVYLNVNRKFTELSGFSRDELIDRNSIELGLLTPEQWQQLLDRLPLNTGNSGIELMLRSKDNRQLTCVYYGEQILVDDKQCLLSLIHDVTEHRTMEAQLRQSQKMEAIGQLAGGVAHDFNNILTVIMGYCNLLQMDTKLDPSLQEDVEQIISSSEKAAQLTRGLLMFSRKEAMDLKRVNLKDVVHHMQKFLLRIIGEDVILKVKTDVELPVNADTGQLEQVLINLATNARDAMGNGGILSIETSRQHLEAEYIDVIGEGTPGEYACLTVSDTGSGMDAETCKKIFEPFFTTKEMGKGTGLGMAIVYGIIKQHKGLINVASEPGSGATFRIYLPVCESKPEAENRCIQELPGRGTETILVVEDEAGVRNLLENILSKYGYNVILADNGQEAVEKFATHKDTVKLVLLDMIMPGKNGQETLAEIRQLGPDVKAMYLSGYTADFMKDRGICNEATELMTKPFQPLDLLRKVREMLDQQQS